MQVALGDVGPHQWPARCSSTRRKPAHHRGRRLPRQPPRKACGSAEFSVVGVDNLLVQVARCCQPLPGEQVGGYLTRGRGVSVHRSDCASDLRLVAREPQRALPVEWGDARGSHGVDIAVEGVDRKYLLKDLTNLIARGRARALDQQRALGESGWCAGLQVRVQDFGSVQAAGPDGSDRWRGARLPRLIAAHAVHRPDLCLPDERTREQVTSADDRVTGKSGCRGIPAPQLALDGDGCGPAAPADGAWQPLAELMWPQNSAQQARGRRGARTRPPPPLMAAGRASCTRPPGDGPDRPGPRGCRKGRAARAARAETAAEISRPRTKPCSWRVSCRRGRKPTRSLRAARARDRRGRPEG